MLLACFPAGAPSAAGADSGKPEWVGPDCDRAWSYQGDLPRRSAPDGVWEALSDEPLAGDLDPALIARLDEVMDSLLVLAGSPALGAAVGIPGGGIWTRTVGVAHAPEQTPLPEPALFHAGSIGKAFTAVLIMQLIEARHLDLGTSVESWFLDFPNSRWITIDHLLTHTAGVYDFSQHKRYSKTERYEPAENLIEFAAKRSPVFCPGAQWSYSNTSYVMLGRIVERMRVMSLQEALRRQIIERVGLEHTVARYDRDAVEGHVTGHLEGEPLDRVRYALPGGAGILSCTPDDLVRLWHALLTGGLVSQASVREMCTGMFPTFGKQDGYYGRGVMMYDVPGRGLIIGHSGGIKGFRSVVGYLVEDGVYVSVLANDDVPVEAALFHLVRTLRAWRAESGG